MSGVFKVGLVIGFMQGWFVVYLGLLRIYLGLVRVCLINVF